MSRLLTNINLSTENHIEIEFVRCRSDDLMINIQLLLTILYNDQDYLLDSFLNDHTTLAAFVICKRLADGINNRTSHVSYTL